MASTNVTGPAQTTPSVGATKPSLKDKLSGFAHKISPKQIFAKHKTSEDVLESKDKPATPAGATSATAAAPAPAAPASHTSIV